MSPPSRGALSRIQTTTSESRLRMIRLVEFVNLWTSLLTPVKKHTACLSSTHLSGLNYRRGNTVGLGFTEKCLILFIRLKGQLAQKCFPRFPTVVQINAGSLSFVWRYWSLRISIATLSKNNPYENCWQYVLLSNGTLFLERRLLLNFSSC